MTEAQADWFANFFEGLAVDLWVAAIPAELTAAEVELIEAELGLAPGARVLDVPVGHGRHAVALGRRGHHFTAGEIQRMPAAAGLTTVQLYGGADRSAYEPGSPQLIVVAERA